MKKSIQDDEQFPYTGLVRIRQILTVLPIGKSTFWAGVRSGKYPKPVQSGMRVAMWRAEDIQALIASFEYKT